MEVRLSVLDVSEHQRTGALSTLSRFLSDRRIRVIGTMEDPDGVEVFRLSDAPLDRSGLVAWALGLPRVGGRPERKTWSAERLAREILASSVDGLQPLP